MAFFVRMVSHTTLFHLLGGLFLLVVAIPVKGLAQNRPKTEVQLAHESKGDLDAFLSSKNGEFQARVFRVNTSKERGDQHHWFIQLLDENQHPVNYAEISLDAYRKGKKSTKLKYMAPVFPLCADGKYIIGFVEPNQTGSWKLEMEIDHFGTKDSHVLEIEIEPLDTP